MERQWIGAGWLAGLGMICVVAQLAFWHGAPAAQEECVVAKHTDVEPSKEEEPISGRLDGMPEHAVQTQLEPPSQKPKTAPSVRLCSAGSWTTRLVQLEHASADDVLPAVEGLLTATGRIMSYAPTNSLIITDTGDVHVRILEVVERLEFKHAETEKIWVHQVQYADVADIAALLADVFETSEGGNAAAASSREAHITMSRMVADPRTNKLIVVANERSYRRIQKLVRKLDVELPHSGRINVVHLKNANAQHVSRALMALVDGGPGALLTGDVSVTANEPTNDLVVVASPRDFLSLRAVIRKLDRQTPSSKRNVPSSSSNRNRKPTD